MLPAVLGLVCAVPLHPWLLSSPVPPHPLPIELPQCGPGSRLCAASLGLATRVCLRTLLPRLPLVYSFGFFSLTSIAYRRVIRVYQYEVGDDLSGRFFSSYFSSSLTVVLPMHSGFPRRLCFLTNPHPGRLGGGSVPLCFTGPASCSRPWGALFPGYGACL
jgi:hypothetical protein